MEQDKIWDKIAKPWQKFRKEIFPDLRAFLKNKKGKILDMCSGSGRNFPAIEGEIYATDFSEEMLSLARECSIELGKRVLLKKADATSLPFQDSYFDYAIFVAALHCIPTKEKREKALKELYRVLKPNAQAFITVWSKNQERVKNKPKEGEIPWTVDRVEYQRYYYLFDQEELKTLLEKIGFRVLEIKEDINIAVTLKK